MRETQRERQRDRGHGLGVRESSNAVILKKKKSFTLQFYVLSSSEGVCVRPFVLVCVGVCVCERTQTQQSSRVCQSGRCSVEQMT